MGRPLKADTNQNFCEALYHSDGICDGKIRAVKKDIQSSQIKFTLFRIPLSAIDSFQI